MHTCGTLKLHKAVASAMPTALLHGPGELRFSSHSLAVYYWVNGDLTCSSYYLQFSFE